MSQTMTIGNSTITLAKCDITDLEIEAFVYHARPDLTLGSGFGTAISIRGGPGVQEELKQHGTKQIGDVVITGAGEMKAQYIIHAVGPAFQEEDLETKLERTIRNVLQEVDKRGMARVAFPPMGAGFYGVPLPQSALITLKTIADYLAGETKIKEIVVCLLDNREMIPFEQQLTAMAQPNSVGRT